jgi:hypothetical protein
MQTTEKRRTQGRQRAQRFRLRKQARAALARILEIDFDELIASVGETMNDPNFLGDLTTDALQKDLAGLFEGLDPNMALPDLDDDDDAEADFDTLEHWLRSEGLPDSTTLSEMRALLKL